MDKDLRASLIAAIAAVALSALIGVIAGVGAAALLLRALACGLLMGAAVYGGIFLLRKTMPELLEPAPEARPEASPLASPLAEPETAETDLGGEALTGANVNIVLPGDEGGEVEMLEPGAEAFAKAKPAFEEDEYVEDAEEAEDAEDASLIEAEDSSGEAAMPPNARAAGSGVAAAAAFDRAGAEASPRAAARPADPAEDRGQRQPGGFDELDVLPDLDGFTDSFTASEFSSGGSGGPGGDRSERMPPVPSGGGSRPSRGGQEGADPAALAQAVRTILKRDQKG